MIEVTPVAALFGIALLALCSGLVPEFPFEA
jgi:hypothetical protein